MSLTIVVLDQEENFLRFLDPDLCELEEEIEYQGLRTLNFNYKFQKLTEDGQLFKKGNKLWVSCDNTNIRDCLYVFNTEVNTDIYVENEFNLQIEEVLVELNNAPLFSQTELTQECFNTVTENDQLEVYVDWNALNAWFGNYFNIGIVQECISEYASRVCLTGTMTRMSLLRQIEEQTGNIFVTRYEKDTLTNVIHRYLDFLNPINVNNDWELRLEYDFINEASSGAVDSNGDATTEDKNSEVTPFDDNDNELQSTYNPDDDEIEDTYTPVYTPYVNINPENIVFRIVDNNLEPIPDLLWDNEDTGFDSSLKSCVIRLLKKGNSFGVDANLKSFVVSFDEYNVMPTSSYAIIAQDPDKMIESIIPDDSYFEIYDTSTENVVFRTCLNHEIGSVHEEVLVFGRNIENVTFETNEENTYTAVSPILGSKDNGLTREQLSDLITSWESLKVTKNNPVPMIVEKVTIKADSLEAAKRSLGGYVNNSGARRSTNIQSNYWSRPYNPQDSINSENPSESTFEFYRATAYWKAPYDKFKNELHVSTDNTLATEYQDIRFRADLRDERGVAVTPKMGVTESSDEDIYAIFNQVCLYLKEHETPEINIEVDVANLRNGEFNNYDLHDKVYVYIPERDELVTARVTKTTKDAKDIAKNTVELSNYVSKNTIKTITSDTYIDADNINFKYPSTKNLQVSLKNTEDDSEILANKLINFALYKIENGSSTFTGKTYTKKTDYTGTATIVLNLDPGDYEMDIYFAGDEIYSESSITIDVNVGGTIEAPAQMTKKTTKAKTTKKTSNTSRTKYVNLHWTKCGKSPDSTKIVAIAKPSASVSDAKKRGVSMTKWYRTVFKNKCPECGHKGTLVFDGGKRNKCVKSAGAHGRGYKIGVPEHEITCNHCDSDFDGVTGLEKDSGHSTRLTTLEKPVKSSTSEFAKLVKGQLFYAKEKVTVKTKSNTNTKNRVTKATIDKKVKKQALAIVKNKTGQAAAVALANWCGVKIKYGFYKNFKKAAKTVLSKKVGNCCDQARLLAEMLDAAGLTQYYKIQYVYTCCGNYHGQSVGHVFLKLTTIKTGKSRYVDPCYTRAPWGHHCNYGGVQKLTNYPNRPF